MTRLTRLRELTLFADLPPADLRHVDALTCEISVPPGTVLIRQGQFGREAFVSRLRARRRIRRRMDGRTRRPRGATRRDGATGGRPSPGDGDRLTPMNVLVMDPRQFADLVSNPRIASHGRGAVPPPGGGGITRNVGLSELGPRPVISGRSSAVSSPGGAATTASTALTSRIAVALRPAVLWSPSVPSSCRSSV